MASVSNQHHRILAAAYLLCGFSMAYAACAYNRVQHTNNSLYTHLKAAKSRSTKPLKIPRVELCGAVLAAQLGERRNNRSLLECLRSLTLENICSVSCRTNFGVQFRISMATCAHRR